MTIIDLRKRENPEFWTEQDVEKKIEETKKEILGKVRDYLSEEEFETLKKEIKK